MSMSGQHHSKNWEKSNGKEANHTQHMLLYTCSNSTAVDETLGFDLSL